MTHDTWSDTVARMSRALAQLSMRDRDGAELSADAGFARWREETLALRSRSGTIYLIGNGASASIASHFAADLAKNGHLHTQVFSDVALMTAIANDMGYEHVFAEPLSRRARRGDMVVAISSSGASPNVLKAVQVARELGLAVVTLSAFAANNPLRSLGTLNAYIAAEDYGTAESCHATILHRWMDLVEIPKVVEYKARELRAL